ncbi:ATP-binding protein [Denitratisoma oestradiolicum]|uniref:histidine kinase n=1 Tax=Denitratisoma oestradiolicum TaxID=311182 RepID=A0A6S6XWC9_9PROT|nr:ATP-binding protein [Denitratisoma oestradiolicum]TWO78926.1 hypothetical protein CBW56_17360 [Denitratisoma oestradiolicum]CAB1370309.1 Histidine kinase [Denitratisoma oestradiolicum]
MRPIGIRERVLFVALAPVAATALTLMLYFTLLRYEDVESSLFNRGATMARQVAQAAEYGMFSGNTIELRRLALSIAREPDVSAIAFFDQQGTLLAATGLLQSSHAPHQLPDNWSARSEDDRTLFFHVKVIRAGAPTFDDPFGQAEANKELSLGSLVLELSRDQLLARKREILLVTLLSAGLILAGAALLAMRLGRDITKPIQALEKAVDRIRQGEMDVRILHHKAKTLYALEEGVNTMTIALDAARTRSDQALASSKAQLNEQHEFANALLQAQSDAGVCMMLIENNRIVHINDAGVISTGYSREEYLALSDIRSFFEANIEASTIEGLLRPFTQTDNTRRFIARFRCKDSEWRFYDIATAALTGTDPPRIVTIALDITQRRNDEERLAVANIELRRQKEEAERASRAKSRFLAAASHDLRQPIHALSLFASEIKSCAASADQLRLAGQINAATTSLTELLDALLDISRLDLTENHPCRQVLPLMPLLEATANAHRRSAEGKGLKLSVIPTRLWAESDPQLLTRIINNLLANAVRYTERGRILLGVRRNGESLRIEVWDSGIGIAPEHQPHLFEEFFQVDNPERDANKGLGLGLSIVARLAQTLDHPIKVRSWPGRGSCFAITLPRSEPMPTLPTAISPIVEPRLTARLLLIDADEGSRAKLAELLRGWGCQVKESMGADDLAGALAPKPDAIICSACCIDHLWQQTSAERLPLIMLGEHTNIPDLRRLAGKLRQPPRPGQLRALLQHVLETDREGV